MATACNATTDGACAADNHVSFAMNCWTAFSKFKALLLNVQKFGRKKEG